MTFEPTRCSRCGRWVVPKLSEVIRACDLNVVVPCGNCGYAQMVTFKRVTNPEPRSPLLSRRVVS